MIALTHRCCRRDSVPALGFALQWPQGFCFCSPKSQQYKVQVILLGREATKKDPGRWATTWRKRPQEGARRHPSPQSAPKHRTGEKAILDLPPGPAAIWNQVHEWQTTLCVTEGPASQPTEGWEIINYCFKPPEFGEFFFFLVVVIPTKGLKQWLNVSLNGYLIIYSTNHLHGTLKQFVFKV